MLILNDKLNLRSKRCLFLGLLLGLSSISLFTGSSASALYPDQVAQCTAANPIPSAHVSNLDSQMFSTLGRHFNPDTDSFLTFLYTNGSTYSYVGLNTPLKSWTNGSNYGFDTGAALNGFRAVTRPDNSLATAGYDDRNPWNFDISCVYDSHNINYLSDWNINQFYSSYGLPPVDYSTAYKLTDAMVLDDDPAYYGNCNAKENIRTNWYTILKSATNVNGYTGTTAKSILDPEIAQLDSAVNAQSFWAVSYGAVTASTGTIKRQIFVYYLINSKTVQLNWSSKYVQLGITDGTALGNSVHMMTISLDEGTADMTNKDCAIRVDTGNTTDMISDDRTPDGGTGSSSRFLRNYFTSGNSLNLNYPTGYTSTPIRTTSPPPPLDESMSFDYDVQGLDITLKNTTPNYGKDQTCHWELDTDPAQAGDNGYEVYQGDLPCNQEVKFHYKEFGYYYASLYLVQDGTTYSITHNFYINGDSYSGAVSLNNDTRKTAYEDCSTANFADVGGQFGCHIRNMVTRFGEMLKFLFVPDSYKLQTSLNSTLDRIKESLGFLYFPFDFIVSLLELISGQGTNPTGAYCNIGNVSAFGSGSVNLELCRWRTQLPQLWDIMVKVAQGGIALVLVSALFRKFTSIMGGDVSGGGDDEDDGTLDTPYGKYDRNKGWL